MTTLRRSVVGILLVAVSGALLPAQASAADRPFAVRFVANDTGQITRAANTVLTCQATVANCLDARAAPTSYATGTGNSMPSYNNNAYTMQYVDTDGDASTFDSSQSDLNLPAGATVLFAGLYWGAAADAGTPFNTRGTVKLRTPASSTYNDIVATTVDDSSTGTRRYQSYADVTNLVQAGGAGSYSVGNIQAAQIADNYAGWSLVVAYRDPTQPARNLSVFDGLQSTNGTAPISITVNGFRTPPNGPVRTTLGFIAYEGDRGITGDTATFNGTQLSDATSPANNFFNSSISDRGVEVTSKTPNYSNQLGYDSDLFNVDGVLANSQTSTTISATTSGDVFSIGVVTFATELFAPRLIGTKTVTDLNGGSVERGDVLRYTIGGQNVGQDGAANLRVTDPVPAGTTFVPGSLQQLSGPPGAGPRTNAGGDDAAEYDAGSNAVRFRVGTGAGTDPDTGGGTLAIQDTFSVAFDVVVGQSPPAGGIVRNRASFAFTSETPTVPQANYSAVTPETESTVVSPDLALTKTHSGDGTRGSNKTFTLNVANVGQGSATGTTTVVDSLPTGLSFVAGTPPTGAGWACTVATDGRSVTCTTTATVAPGAAFPPITVPTAVALDAPASVQNVAAVTNPSDTNATNDTGRDTLAIASSADLAITKTTPTTTGVVGDQVTYAIVATNNGPSTATSVVVADTLPAGLTLVGTPNPTQGTCTTQVRCALGTLAPGASATITLTARLATAGAGSGVTNTATVTADQPDPAPANNSATAGAITVAPQADLSITKSAAPDPVVAGRTITYTFTVTNRGPNDAVNARITDTLPAGLRPGSTTPAGACTPVTPSTPRDIRCDLGTVPSGATRTVTVTATVDSDVLGTLTNTANTASDTPDPNTANNAATVSSTVTGEADLAIVKTASPNPVRAGQTLTYTLTVTNGGPSTARDVRFRDALPTGFSATTVTPAALCSTAFGTTTLTCAVGDIPTGQTSVVTIEGTVAPGFSGTLANIGTVSSTTTDPTAGNNSSTASVTVQESPDLRITKEADVSQQNAGGAIVYTVRVTNAGTGNARAVTVTDPVPAAATIVTLSPDPACQRAGQNVTCNLGTLAPGASSVVTIATRVDPAFRGNLTNTATASTPSGGNPVQATVSTPIAGSADLRIGKVGPMTAVPGGPIAWTVSVDNDGPSTATDVVVADDVPNVVQSGTITATAPDGSAVPCTVMLLSVRCNVGTLAPAGRFVVRISGTLDPSARTQFTNTATVNSSTNDPALGNNSASALTGTNASADLVTTKTVVGPVVAGGPIQYQITVRNAGPSTSDTYDVRDTLPASIQSPSIDPPASSNCSIDAGLVRCTFTGQAPGATTTVIVRGTLAPDTTGSVANTASTASQTPSDPNTANNTSTATATATTSADVSVVKSAPQQATPGGSITYGLTVRNTGPSVARNVNLADDVPAAITVTGVTPTPQCAVAQAVRCALGNLNPGDTRIITVTGAIAPGARGTVTNTATTTSDTSDPTPGNNRSQASTTLSPSADIALTKATVPAGAVAVAGQAVTYDLTATNNGPSTAGQTTVTDTLDAAFGAPTVVDAGGAACTVTGQTVSCVRSTALAPTGTFTVRLSAVLSPAYTGAAIANAATASSDVTDPNPGNEAPQISTPVRRSADVSIQNTVAPGSVQAGQTATYTLAVANAGPSTAANTVVEDTIPAGQTPGTPVVTGGSGTCTVTGQNIRCVLGDLAPGATRTIQVPVTVSPAATPGTVANPATVTTDTPDPTDANNRSSASLTITAAADLSVTKTASSTRVVAGTALSYTLTARNAGPSVARAAVLTDALPTGFTPGTLPAGCTLTSGTVTCQLGDLNPNDTAARTIPGTVDPAARGTLSNTASVASPTQDPDPTNNQSAAVGTPIDAQADLAVTKVADPSPAGAGGPISYRITVTNNGPSSAVNVRVSDGVPAGIAITSVTPAGCTTTGQLVACALGDLAPSASRVVTITGTVDAGLQANQVVNSATATSDTPDPGPSSNTGMATTPITRAADLHLDKTVAPTAVLPGGQATYTLTVRNDGPASATSVALADPLPTGVTYVGATPSQGTCDASVSCALGDLAPGATATVTITVTADAGAGGTAPVNRATVTSPTFDPDTDDNAASATLSIAASVDLVARVSVTPDAVTPTGDGAPATFTFGVRNDGPSTDTGVAATLRVPDGVVITGVPQGCTVSGQVVRCPVGTLAAGASSPDFQVSVRIPPALGGQTLTGQASAAGGVQDRDPTNDTATASLAVAPVADLSVIKTPTGTAQSGGTAAWTIQVANNGPVTATGVEVTDELPAGVTLAPALASQGACTLDGRTLVCDLGSIPAGGGASIALTATVDASVSGTLRNTATVAGDQADPDPSNNTSEAAGPVAPAPATPVDLVVTKTLAGTPTIGRPSTYTITVRNAGTNPAADTVITDALPKSLDLRSIRASQGTCSTSSVSCALGTIAPGATATITVVAVPTTTGSAGNTATAVSAGQEVTPKNNVAGVTAQGREPRATLAVTKRADQAKVRPGGTLHYTITVSNTSKVTARGVTVCDKLPMRLSLKSAPGASFVKGQACWRIKTLKAGQKRSYRLTAVVDADARPQDVVNQARAVADNARARTASARTAVRGTQAVGPSGGATG